MTLNGAMRNHLKDLKIGFLTILPVCDTIGRAVIYCNSSSLDVKQHYNGRDLVRFIYTVMLLQLLLRSFYVGSQYLGIFL